MSVLRCVRPLAEFRLFFTGDSVVETLSRFFYSAYIASMRSGILSYLLRCEEVEFCVLTSVRCCWTVHVLELCDRVFPYRNFNFAVLFLALYTVLWLFFPLSTPYRRIIICSWVQCHLI